MINLLVATDLSQRSAHAVQRAAQLIRQQGGGEWGLLHVVDGDAPSDFVAEHVQRVERLLQAQAQPLAEQAGSRPRVLVSSGEVEPLILEACLGLGADLLLLGTHRQSALRGFFTGTTAERVIRGSHLPVLRVAQPAEQAYRHALVALDLSPISRQALQRARQLGLLDPLHCIALHALEPLPKGMLVDSGIEQRVMEKQTAEALQALQRGLQEDGLRLPEGCLRVLQGEPGDVIAQALRQSPADLLVIGSHARRGLPRLVLGSVAARLLSELDCDILCVPPRA